nr:PREDICTED: uncharacterized protein LOC108218678 isoform X3 [Daucus carota subsp. sativus]
MTDEPRTYVGGDIDYIDFCNADQISLIEIFSMLKEIEVEGGFHVLWYKLPGTNFDKGLFPIDRDAELLTMCELIPPSKFIEIYVSTMPHINTAPPPETNLDEPDVQYVEPTPKEPVAYQGYSDFVMSSDCYLRTISFCNLLPMLCMTFRNDYALLDYVWKIKIHYGMKFEFVLDTFCCCFRQKN